MKQEMQPEESLPLVFDYCASCAGTLNTEAVCVNCGREWRLVSELLSKALAETERELKAQRLHA